MQLELDDILSRLSQSTDLPLIAAFTLGLLVALNPCQLAICTSALAYECKKGKGFPNAIAFATGRATTYTLLGWITMCLIGGGKNVSSLQHTLSLAEAGIPYILIPIGLYLIFRAFHRHQHDGEKCHNSGKIIKRNAPWGSFVLGSTLALAFCPESAIFYFGMMIPLSLSSSTGAIIPIIFGLSASIPTIFIGWVMKKAFNKAQSISKSFERFQQGLNIVTGLIFIILATLLLTHQ